MTRLTLKAFSQPSNVHLNFFGILRKKKNDFRELNSSKYVQTSETYEVCMRMICALRIPIFLKVFPQLSQVEREG